MQHHCWRYIAAWYVVSLCAPARISSACTSVCSQQIVLCDEAAVNLWLPQPWGLTSILACCRSQQRPVSVATSCWRGQHLICTSMPRAGVRLQPGHICVSTGCQATIYKSDYMLCRACKAFAAVFCTHIIQPFCYTVQPDIGKHQHCSAIAVPWAVDLLHHTCIPADPAAQLC